MLKAGILWITIKYTEVGTEVGFSAFPPPSELLISL
jgi:hypothetical protein